MKQPFQSAAFLSNFFLLLVFFSANPALSQTFQRQYGTSFDNAFTKVIRSGSNYFVLGSYQATAGGIKRASVTRLDANGQHIWTLYLNIASEWNDAVLTPNGNLLVVGNTLGATPNIKSLMGLVTTSGTFSWVRSYESAGRDAFTRIVRNPSPQVASFPYYVLGYQYDPSMANVLWDDIVLLNVNENGTMNWKKRYASIDDDEFGRDLLALPNGDLLICGNQGSQGVIYRTDKQGDIYSGVTPGGLTFSYADVAPANGGGFYAVGNTFPGFQAYLMKYDNDLIGIWDVSISGLTGISQVWDEPANGGIYVTGTGVFNGKSRAVILRFNDSGGSPALDWVRFLDNSELSYSGGSTTFVSPNRMAFVDGRLPGSGGFGQLCAFMSVSDLEMSTCITVDDVVAASTVNLLYDGPSSPNIQFYDTPIPANESGQNVGWQQQDVCTDCTAGFTFQPINACGNFQFNNTSVGPTPLSYTWSFGDPNSGPNNISTAQNPTHQFSICGNFKVCLTINGNNCADSICQTVVFFDQDKPVITCPQNLTLNCNTNTNPPATGVATATDNCTPSGSISITHSDVVGGQLPCDASIVRTWRAEDACFNTSTCLQTILIIDNVPPAIVCPPNATVNTNTGVCFYTGIIPQATASDNCDPNPQITCSLLTANQSILITPQTMFPKGTNTITCFARDACNNQSMNCNFTLTVEDKEPPVIICPLSMTVVGSLNPQGLCKAVVDNIEPAVSDNCPMLQVNYSIAGATTGTGANDASGTLFMEGPSTITYTATDMGGNVKTCSFTVTVRCTPNQPNSEFKCGMAVISCFSGFSPPPTVNPSGPVLAVVDIRNHATAPLGMNWSALTAAPNALPGGVFHHQSWDAQHMGQIFGVTIDGSFNIYTSSTTIYGRYLPSNLTSADFGNVYRIDAATFQPVKIATLPQNLAEPAGLGDVWYDGINNQLLVSNFHDGAIYSLNPTNGSTNWTYVFPGVPGSPFFTSNPGFAPLGKRVWAVARQGSKMYFSVWNEDRNRNSTTLNNQIYAVQLDAQGMPIANTLIKELDLPDLPGFTYSSPVSDITFSSTGNMLVAERSMKSDFGDAAASGLGSQAHAGRIIEFSGANWSQMKTYYVGNANSLTQTPLLHSNSAGGADYGYESFDPSSSPLPVLCDSVVWGTGDALRHPNHNSGGVPDLSSLTCGGGFSDFVYGLAGMRWTGNSNVASSPNYVKKSSIYIDADNNLCTGEKIQIGDVDVFKDCIVCPSEEPEYPCDSVMTMLTPVNSPNSQQCCYSLDLKNLYGGITKICANLTTPGWVFNTSNPATAAGYNLSLIGANTICITHNSGTFPVGANLQNVLQFCLAETQPNAAPVQTIAFDWYVGNAIVCQTKNSTECNPPTDKDTCFVITNLKADCIGKGLDYCLTFTITNISGAPAAGFVLQNLPSGYLPGDCGCGGFPYGSGGWLFDWTSNPLPNNSSRQLCVKVTSPIPVSSPQTICFNGTLDITPNCCTAPKDWCVELKPCCDPCEDLKVTANPDGDCCYTIDLDFDCSNGYFTRIDFDIVTSGVYFGSHALAGSWNTCVPPSLTNICIEPPLGVLNSGTYNNVIRFCLTDINMPNEVPQVVKVTFWTTGSNGQDSMACDRTLIFECQPDTNFCLFITDEKIECLPDQQKYQITVTVQNLSTPSFAAHYLAMIGPGLSPNPVPLAPPLPNDGSTRTVTFCYTPNPWPDADGKLILTYRLKDLEGDTCCNGNLMTFDTLMLPPCDTCSCDTLANLYWRPTQGAPNQMIHCGDSLTIDCPAPGFNITFGGTFGCIGDSCPAAVNWVLREAATNHLVGSGTATPLPGFQIPLPASYFFNPGVYELFLIGECDGKLCEECRFTIVAKGCECCQNYEIFSQNVANAVDVMVNDSLCKVTLQIGGLPDCDIIKNIAWGDGTASAGPFMAGDMPMHTYLNSGNYVITYWAEEYNGNAMPAELCFEKQFDVLIALEDCTPTADPSCCAYDINLINLHQDGRIKKVRVSALCDTKICCADPDEWGQNFDPSNNFVEWFPADGSPVPEGAVIDNDFVIFLDRSSTLHDLQVEWFDASDNVVCRHIISIDCNGSYSDDEDWLLYTHTTTLNDPKLLVFAVREPDADEEITDCDEEQEERAGCPQVQYQVYCNGGNSYFVQLFLPAFFNSYAWQQENASTAFAPLQNATSNKPYFIATQSGAYIYSVIADAGKIGKCSLDVEIIIPDIQPGFTAQQLPCGTEVQFNPSGWGDPNDVSQISWVCTPAVPGFPTTTTTAPFTVTFPVPASPSTPDLYTVTMIIEDKYGCFHQTSPLPVNVDISCKPSFKYNLEMCYCPQGGTATPTVHFTNTSTGGACPGTTWTWNFGDGSIIKTTDETELSFDHLYNVSCPSKTFMVTVTMTSTAPVPCTVQTVLPVTLTRCDVDVVVSPVCPDGKYVFTANVPGEWSFPGALEIAPWPYSDKPDANGRRKKVAVRYPTGTHLVTFMGYCGENGPCPVFKEIDVKVDCYTKRQTVSEKYKYPPNQQKFCDTDWAIKYKLSQKQAGGHKIKASTVFKKKVDKGWYCYRKRALAYEIQTSFTGKVYKSDCTTGCNYASPDNTSGDSGTKTYAKKARAKDVLGDKYRSWENSIKSTHRVWVDTSFPAYGLEFYLYLGKKCDPPKWYCPPN